MTHPEVTSNKSPAESKAEGLRGIGRLFIFFLAFAAFGALPASSMIMQLVVWVQARSWVEFASWQESAEHSFVSCS